MEERDTTCLLSGEQLALGRGWMTPSCRETELLQRGGRHTWTGPLASEHCGQNLGGGRVYQKAGNCGDQHCGHQCIVLEDSGVCTPRAPQTGRHSGSGHRGLAEGEADSRMVRTSEAGTPASQQAEPWACDGPRVRVPADSRAAPPGHRGQEALAQDTGQHWSSCRAPPRGTRRPGPQQGRSSWGVTSSRGRSPAGPAGTARRTRVPAGRGAQVPSSVSRDAGGESAASSRASMGT